MPYRIIPFVNGEFYHIYNRGLDKQITFLNSRDYSFFIQSLFYYRISSPKPKFSLYRQSKMFNIDKNNKIVDIICYCLMPNHFHLLVKQLQDGGISEFMRKFIHSYTKYRNVKYKRQGAVFNGVFRAKRIVSDEQFIHVSRYIHLNPYVSQLTKDLTLYPWSSYNSYIDIIGNRNLAKEDIFSFFNSPKEYQKFVLDQKDYGTTLEILKHLTIDVEEE